MPRNRGSTGDEEVLDESQTEASEAEAPVKATPGLDRLRPYLDALPSSILACVSAPGGGRLMLVTGAGSSMDWPTNLKSGGDYSEIAFCALVGDRLLSADACTEPRDLSLLADVVYQTHQSQHPLTDRLPRNEWRNATPNEGHRIAAALLIEGVIRSIITLNYDLAFQSALQSLGAPSSISVAKGPEDHVAIGNQALIYLHRSAESDPESWVLRKADLDDGWRGGWEAMVAAGCLSAPVTLFAGLGSPAAVLTETVSSLAGIAGSEYFFADPYPDGKFLEALGPHLTAVVEMGWIDLMREISARVAAAQTKEVEMSCRALAQERGLSATRVPDICASLGGMGIVAIGMLRAAWLFHSKPFCPAMVDHENARLADLLTTVSVVAEALDADAIFRDGGVCELRLRGSERSVSFMCAHGSGMHTWATIQARLEMRRPQSMLSIMPRVVIGTGLVADTSQLPEDLVHGDRPPDDLVRGHNDSILVDAAEIRGSLTSSRDELLTRLAG